MDTRAIVRYRLNEIIHYSGFSLHRLKSTLLNLNPPFSFFDLIDIYIKCSLNTLGTVGSNRFISKREIDTLLLNTDSIKYDSEGIVNKFYPCLSNQEIVINPFINSGRPILERKGIATKTISNRFKSGESIQKLSYDYECSPSDIESALRFEFKEK